MGKRESLAQFRKADQLFREGNFIGALEILDELDRRYPGQKNIMLPRARCFTYLGQTEQALALCNDVIRKFGDPKAVSLARDIEAARASGQQMQATGVSMGSDPLEESEYNGGTALADLTAQLDSTVPRTEPDEVKPVAPVRKWPKILAICAGVLFALAFLTLPFLAGDGDSGSKTGQSPSAPVEIISVLEDGRIAVLGYTFTWLGWFLFIVIGNLGLNTIYYTINLYVTLYIVNKLPHDQFQEDLLDVAVTSAVATLLNFLCCIGLLVQIKMLYDKYDFGLIEFLILLSVALGVGFSINMLFYAVMAVIGADLQAASAMTGY